MIITVTNQKGGIGKTTTAHNMGAGLAKRGYNVLLVDLEPSRNLTTATGGNKNSLTSLEMLLKQATAADCIQHIKRGLDLIPGSADMALDLQLTKTGKEYILKESLQQIAGQYDFIIIDTPPTLSTETISALTAADTVIIPSHAAIFSMDALLQLYDTISTIQKYTNNGLKIAGILITCYKPRTVLHRDFLDKYNEFSKALNIKIFSAKIRDTIAVNESQARQQDLYEYAPGSAITADYDAFITEFLQDQKQGRKAGA